MPPLPPLSLFTRWAAHGRVHVGLVALGAVLRTVQFFSGRSLWMDEAFFALNLRDYSLREMLRAMDYEVAVAPGFLVVQKAVVGMLGTGELALRLVPFLCSLAALGVFFHVARRVLSPAAAGLALFFFAVTPSLVYYASELRPYGVDVLVALLLLIGGLNAHRDGFTVRSAGILASVGLVALLFSFPSVFVLAGIGTGLLLAVRPDREKMVRALAVGGTWVAGFGALYFGYIVRHGHSAESFALWQHRFLQLPGRSPGSWLEAAERNAELLLGSLAEPLGFALGGLAALLVVFGALALRGRAGLGAFLLLPLAFTGLASFLQRYPFHDRLLLFLVPFALLLVAAGAEWVGRRLPGRAASVLFALFLLAPPLYVAAANALQAPLYYVSEEEARPLFAELADRAGAEDVVYLHPLLEPLFRYYAPKTGLERVDVRYLDLGPTDKWNRTERPSWRRYLAAAEVVQRHPRAWVVLYPTSDLQAGTLAWFFTDCLGHKGELLGRITKPGVVAYAFAFDPDAALTPACTPDFGEEFDADVPL